MNDWLDYKGSGSARAYRGDSISDGISHYGVKGMKWDPSKLFGKGDEDRPSLGDHIRKNADKLVKTVGDAQYGIPKKSVEFTKQLDAYKNQLEAKKEQYINLANKANKLVDDINDPSKILDRANNVKQYNQYVAEANKVQADMELIMANIKKDSEDLAKEINDNAILGPILKKANELLASAAQRNPDAYNKAVKYNTRRN